MSVNIVVPEVGESIVDARVARWLKKEGDAVAAGEALVELETDKVDVEVAAPRTGVLATISHGDGADVKIGDVLGTIIEGARRESSSPAKPAGAAARTAAPVAPAATAPGPVAAESGPAASTAAGANGAPAAATPSARRAAREQDLDVGAIRSDGPRVTRDDVLRQRTAQAPAASAGATGPAAPPAAEVRPGPSERPPTSQKPGAAATPPTARRETRQRMSKRRATIARRLVEVQQTAAMLTTFNEVDMTAVMAARERHKEAFKKAHGVSLGVASFFVKAAVAALRAFPRLNAEVQGDEMVLKHYYDIGVAVGAAEGLVVPVLRDADQMAFADIEVGIREFARRANDGSLTLEDLRGGTFTITNGGVFGSLMSTPILNPPQVGILGLHIIKDRPVAVDGQVMLRPMMYTALTYDHRIVDGAEAVQFLVRVKDLVEDPASLLLAT